MPRVEINKNKKGLVKTFFLSAGVPLRSRNPTYYETADIVAIRESLRGFLAAVLPTSRVVFGGQAAITPMFRRMAQEMGLTVRDHIVLYQSQFFRMDFPTDNEAFENIVLTADLGEREESLALMRDEMLGNYKFDAGVFIGGMEGVEVEWELFRKKHPSAPCYPIATTGAAARIVFDSSPDLPSDLASEFAYLHLFRKYLMASPA